jgi:FtsP/CotA-like multicopper oxidase with cupredoxin domain
VKQYTPPAQIKNTLQTQSGIRYAQIIKQNSYKPTNKEQEPHTNQSHQQTSDMQDLKKHDETPV